MGKPRARILAALLLLFALLLSAAAAVLPSTMAQGDDAPPVVTIDLEPGDEQQTVDVAFTQAPLTVRGTIDVEMDPLRRETLDLSVQGADYGWSVSPSSKSVLNGASFSFTASGVVPQGADEGDHLCELTVTWYDIDSAPHETSEPFTIRVFKVPFTSYLSSDSLPLDAGASTTVTLFVQDHSPTGNDYSVAVGDPSPGEPVPWLPWFTALLDAERLSLGAGDHTEIELALSLPANATESTVVVPVRVEVEGWPEYTQVHDVKVFVQGQVPVPSPGGGDADGWEWLPFDPAWLMWMGLLAVIVGFIGFFGFTEVGILMVLWGLLMPLFTRLKRDEVLSQFTRGEIFGFVKANPGVHLTAIKENLGLSNGVLAYHLKVLIREEFIVARREGGYKRFYPRDMRVPRKRVHFTRLQLDIVDKLRLHPGTTQASLARMLGESKQVISYNLSVLIAAEVVRVEKEGGRTRCYVDRRAPKTFPGESGEVEEVEEEAASPRASASPVRQQ